MVESLLSDAGASASTVLWPCGTSETFAEHLAQRPSVNNSIARAGSSPERLTPFEDLDAPPLHLCGVRCERGHSLVASKGHELTIALAAPHGGRPLVFSIPSSVGWQHQMGWRARLPACLQHDSVRCLSFLLLGARLAFSFSTPVVDIVCAPCDVLIPPALHPPLDLVASGATAAMSLATGRCIQHCTKLQAAAREADEIAPPGGLALTEFGPGRTRYGTQRL